MFWLEKFSSAGAPLPLPLLLLLLRLLLLLLLLPGFLDGVGGRAIR